jgi:hypothetical protein
MALKERPDAWTRVDAILETSSNETTKFFALSILDDAITYRWRSMPPDQREAVKKYLVAKIMGVSCRASACVFRGWGREGREEGCIQGVGEGGTGGGVQRDRQIVRK